MSEPPPPPLRPDINPARPEHFIRPDEGDFQDIPGMPGMQVRDLRLWSRGGKIAAQVFRASPDRKLEPGPKWAMHDMEWRITYVVRGWILTEIQGMEPQRMEAGACIYHLPNSRSRTLALSPDYEAIAVKSTNIDKITGFAYNEETGDYDEQSIALEIG